MKDASNCAKTFTQLPTPGTSAGVHYSPATQPVVDGGMVASSDRRSLLTRTPTSVRWYLLLRCCFHDSRESAVVLRTGSGLGILLSGMRR